MTKNNYIKIGMLAVAMILSMSMYAQKGGGECKNNGTPQCENRIPDLSDEQKSSIDALRVKHRGEMTNYRADLNILKAELQKLEIANEPNSKSINSKIDEIYDLKSKMAKNKSKHRQEVRSLLSDEQKVFFDAHSGKRKGYGKEGKGKGYNRG